MYSYRPDATPITSMRKYQSMRLLIKILMIMQLQLNLLLIFFFFAKINKPSLMLNICIQYIFDLHFIVSQRFCFCAGGELKKKKEREEGCVMSRKVFHWRLKIKKKLRLATGEFHCKQQLRKISVNYHYLNYWNDQIQ